MTRQMDGQVDGQTDRPRQIVEVGKDMNEDAVLEGMGGGGGGYHQDTLYLFYKKISRISKYYYF